MNNKIKEILKDYTDFMNEDALVGTDVFETQRALEALFTSQKNQDLLEQKQQLRKKAQQKVKQYKKDVLRADLVTKEIKYALIQGAEETRDTFLKLLED